MERIENTTKPLSSLTGIRKFISYDDNSTNVKYQSKTKLEGLNNLLLDRQESINQIRFIEKDVYNTLVTKLKRVLSKKFVLSEQEYLLLVDKYNLKKNALSRDTIMEMIQYLNFQKKYNIDAPVSKKSNVSIERQVNHKNIHASPYNSIITSDCEPKLEFLDKQADKQTFEDRLLKMQMDRDATNPVDTRPPTGDRAPPDNLASSGKPSFGNQLSFDTQVTNANAPAESRSININESKIEYDMSVPLTIRRDNISVHDDFPATRSDVGGIARRTDNDVVGDLHPQLVISETEVDNSKIITNDSSDKKSTIETSLERLIEDLKKRDIRPPPPDVIKETQTLNLMANIISSTTTINSTSNQFEFNIGYNNKNVIENVTGVEFVSCFVNKSFYEKNNFKNSPYFIIKVREFDDILYLNDTNVGGFCQIMWEHKHNYYNYINSDKLFGIYTPKTEIKLDKLTIEIYNHKGELLGDIKSTNNDQFNIILKITQTVS